jgi:hypothetical protein
MSRLTHIECMSLVLSIISVLWIDNAKASLEDEETRVRGQVVFPGECSAKVDFKTFMVKGIEKRPIGNHAEVSSSVDKRGHFALPYQPFIYYDFQLYELRENGGFDNWVVIKRINRMRVKPKTVIRFHLACP